MKPRDIADLLLLAALWGGSLPFMRVAAPEFGPLALIAVRVAVAAIVLLPLWALRPRRTPWTAHAWPLVWVGLFNSALPFSLFAFATLTVTAGFAAILNATAPLWGAVIAHYWLRERLTRWRVLGLALGVVGVAALVWGKTSFAAGGSGWAIAAAIAATASYGWAACYARRALAGVDALTVATGSQLGAALVLAPLAFWSWPASRPSTTAWVSVIALGLACTALAYILYFRLIANVGAGRAIAVTCVAPLFAVLWGGLWLGESVTPQMLAGAAVMLAGTALAVGLIRPRQRAIA